MKNDTRVNYEVKIFEGIFEKNWRNKFSNTNTKFDSMPGDELIKKVKLTEANKEATAPRLVS